MLNFRFDELRFDAAKSGKTKINDSGYLETEATITRTGVFLYKNADGSVTRELRHPDDVFKADSLETLKMIPITDGHQAMVNSKSAKELQRGQIGENIRVDGKYIKAPMVVMDEEAISKIKNGKNQLSLGYEARIIKEDGVYNGQPYDSRQVDIKYNHLAICNNARAGAEACIRLDSNDAFLITDDENLEDFKKKDFVNKKQEGVKMPTIKLDGIDYEAAPEVINAHIKLQVKCDDLQSDIDSKKTLLDELDAEKERLQAKLDEYEANYEKTIANAVSERTKLLATAKNVLPKMDSLDKLSNIDIKKAVIKEVNDNVDLTDKSDDYINARFDAALEMHEIRSKNFANQNSLVNGVRTDASNDNPLALARTNLMKRTQEGK